MHTMHSRVDDDSSPRKKSMSEATGGGARGSGGGGGGGGGGVRYYLRRGSMQQVAAKTRKILAGTTGSGSDDENRDRAQTSSSPKCGHSSPRRGGGGRAEGGVNFYLRRPSLQGLPTIEKLLSGGGAKGDEGGDAAAGDLGAGGASSAYDGRKGEGAGGDGDNEVSSMARDMAAAVASFEAAAAAAAAAGAESRNASDGNGDCANCLEEQSVLGRVEAGRGIQGSRGVGEVVRGDELARRDREEEGEEGGGGGGGGRIKRVSAKLFEGMRDGARDLAAQVQVTYPYASHNTCSFLSRLQLRKPAETIRKKAVVSEVELKLASARRGGGWLVVIAWITVVKTPESTLTHVFARRAMPRSRRRRLAASWSLENSRKVRAEASNHSFHLSHSHLISPAQYRANGSQAPTAARRMTRRGAIAAPCTRAQTLSRERGAKASSTIPLSQVLKRVMARRLVTRRSVFPLWKIHKFALAKQKHGRAASISSGLRRGAEPTLATRRGKKRLVCFVSDERRTVPPHHATPLCPAVFFRSERRHHRKEKRPP